MASVLSNLKCRHFAWLVEATCEKYGDRPATRVWRDEQWQVDTYRQLRAKAHRIAAALIDAGVQRGDRVALLAANNPEWTQIDIALAQIGAVLVPLYGTSTADQITHICNDSGAVLLFVGDQDQAEQAIAAKENLEDLREIISFFPVPGLRTLAEFSAAEPSDEQLAEIDHRMGQASQDDLFSLTYTSGTTGQPRGVMLTHRNLLAELESLDSIFEIEPTEHSLCFLPLSHALERGWSSYLIALGCMNTYVSDTRKVAEMLVRAKPTMLVSVPKLFETVYTTAKEKVENSKLKKAIFNWAIETGYRTQELHRQGKAIPVGLRLKLKIANKTVFSKIRYAMGGQKTVLACGGAPIRKEIEEFFSACGLPILTGYGLTEAAPLVSFNRPSQNKIGTAGLVMPGGEIKIAAESEILYRGENVMAGYWNDPEATAEAIDADGWLHTGDAGRIDEDGFLVITDRLKNIIVTMGGKNVAAQEIESLVLADPLFEQAVLLGDNRPYLTMIVKPNDGQLAKIAQQMKLRYEDLKENITSSPLMAEIKNRIAQATEKLPRHEQIKDILVTMEEFTQQNGLLTPSLKVRRKEVEKRFAKKIEEMYEKLAQARKARHEKN